MMADQQNLRYVHADLEKQRKFLRFLLKWIGFTLLAKLDQVDGMENIPAKGSGIILINHIAFIDPIVVLHALNRNIVPLAKVEAYDYPLIGLFPKMWGVVPIKRDEVDRRAIQIAMSILNAGEIILVAPEGTRHHELQVAKVGLAYLASRTDAPVIPVAIDGTPGFPVFRTAKRWRQPGAHIRIGKPFRFHPDLKRARGNELRLMTEEAMYVLSSLLPQNRRGVYSDLSQATQDTIVW